MNHQQCFLNGISAMKMIFPLSKAENPMGGFEVSLRGGQAVLMYMKILYGLELLKLKT